MSDCIPCKVLANCLQFEDFAASQTQRNLYLSTAQNVTVTCPSNTVVTVPLEGGIVTYMLNFQLGNPPYPNLTLNCTGNTISIPVPDNTTQADLDALIQGMLNQCLKQIAVSIGCVAGSFFNTQQNYQPCPPSGGTVISGAVPGGVTVVGGIGSLGIVMAPGTIQSTVSVADANSKAQEVLREIYSTGNVTCNCGG